MYFTDLELERMRGRLLVLLSLLCSLLRVSQAFTIVQTKRYSGSSGAERILSVKKLRKSFLKSGEILDGSGEQSP